jgi:osmotically-inducible protein OsmY
MKLNSAFARGISIAVLAALLTGCGAIVVGGIAAGAKVAHDRRTTGTFVEDQNILLKAIEMRDQDPELQQNANVNLSAFNLQVLFTGQAENMAVVERFRDRVLTIPRVRTVLNEVTIGAESTWSEATADAYLTSKVKLALFSVDIENFDPTRVKVISSLGSVYLMGLLTPAEADAVTEVARFVSGVKRVVKLFEYIDG